MTSQHEDRDSETARFCREQIHALNLAHQAAIKPYVDELVKIASYRLTPHIVALQVADGMTWVRRSFDAEEVRVHEQVIPYGRVRKDLEGA